MKKNIIKLSIILGIVTTSSLTVMAESNQHKVKKGDTLYRISHTYGEELEDVITYNPQIVNPNLIYPDDLVNIGNNPNITGLIGASKTSEPNFEFQGNFGSSAEVNSKASANSIETEVATLVNKYRSEAGLPPLKLVEDVSNVARVKSEDMRDNRYFDHNSPVYGDPFSMLNTFGISYKTAGENIAKGQKTAESVMNAWMNSEGHRKNIMNPSFKEIGVGYVTDSSGTTYWTQQFVTR